MLQVKKILRELRARLFPDALYLEHVFVKQVGYKLNLKNPQTFNEKLQWLKINYRKPLLTQCADKYAVREYIATVIGEQYLIPLIHVTDEPNDLLTFEFPDYPCIVKSNHDSGGYQIIRDNNVDRNKLVTDASGWIKNNHFYKTKEWQYKNIKPKIIIEKLLMDENGHIPNDIKFSCINGRAEIVHVDSNKEVKHLRNNYTREFEPLAMNWPAEYDRNVYFPKSKVFPEARQLAEILAKPFPFVRVDFYFVGENIYFGELTFHPTSGFGRFSPNYYDFKYGSKLTLPKVI
ncbi:hypothetical protein MUA02_12030 [Enterobacteriaceae bacterium H20N1]|uniref:Uncharacterized protein n=1 Tax=Dryocola boscaweniae TaxID=2925397 RepID=A0A9X3AND1_9ENTR|nr:ATP-grasp fold amidoligase family protein [Dryocola boscaweniae]MCT4702592.1 hypothetical protein [Dryocola boscaweniae]MCT4719760.1 hypothetical protein [Dryocola boscaweniae]